VEEGWRVCRAGRGVQWDENFGYNLACRRGCCFHESICACGVENYSIRLIESSVPRRLRKGTFAIKAVCQCSAAAFMPPRPPFRIYCACTCRKDARVWVFVVVVASYRWKAERLYMSTRKSHSEDGLLGMESLCEELGGERESAEILKHFRRQGMIQWMSWGWLVDVGQSQLTPEKFWRGRGTFPSPSLLLYNLEIGNSVNNFQFSQVRNRHIDLIHAVFRQVSKNGQNDLLHSANHIFSLHH
jgi:hypothetical protein